MSATIENYNDLDLLITVDGVEYIAKKAYVRLSYSGNYLRIRWHDLENTTSRYYFQFLYTDVTNPVSASAAALYTTVYNYLLPNTSGITDGDKGDIVVSGGGTVWTVDSAVLAGKENAITAGTSSQYWRGDKTWQTLNSTAVGLGNVPNTDATNPANISQSASYRFVTDTEKSTWNGKQAAYTILTTLGGLANSSGWLKNDGAGALSYATPSKTDVGLGNVANVDTTDPANITQSASYRFVTDAEKSTWNGKQTAYTILTTFGSLANSAGYLYNNGSGTLSYTTPTVNDVPYLQTSFTIATGNSRHYIKRIQIQTTARITLQGTSRLRLSN